MVQTDLSILTALLCGAKERKSPPHLSGQEKCLEDICYEEFEQDDLQPVARFFLSNWPSSYYTCVLADGAVSLPAQAKKMKQFC